MLNKIIIFAFTAVMGFTVGASFIWSIEFGPLSYAQSYQESATQEATNPEKRQGQHKHFLWAPESPTDFFTLWIAVFTCGLALSTVGLWIVTGRSVELARDEFNASHRPKIRIKHVWIMNEVLDDETLTFQLVFTNVGSAAAQIHAWGLTTVVIPAGDFLPPNLAYPILEPPIATPLDIGFTFVWPATDLRGEPPISRVLSHREAINLRSRTHTLYCIGHVEYRDPVGGFRRTNFCRVLEMAPTRGVDRDTNRLRVFDDPDYEYED